MKFSVWRYNIFDLCLPTKKKRKIILNTKKQY